jgi:hypothetical protein
LRELLAQSARECLRIVGIARWGYGVSRTLIHGANYTPQ